MKIKLAFCLILALWCASAHAQSGAPVVQGNIAATSSNCATAFSCVWQNVLPSNAGTTSINVSGTFTATLTVEESNNGGLTWASVGTISSAGTTTYSTNGFTDIRVRCSAYTSGTAAVTINTGLLQVQSVVSSGSGGATIVTTLPASCTSSVSQNVILPPFGEFFCSPTTNGTSAWVPENPSQTISPLAYGAKADWKYTYSAGFTSGQPTVTCTSPDCNFSSADVGKQMFGILSTSFVVLAPSSTVAFPLGTITAVNSPTNVTVSSNSTTNCSPSSSQSCAFAWGTQDDTTALNNAATAAWSTPGVCRAVQLPGNGAMLFSGGIFNITAANLSSPCGGIINTGSGVDSTQTGPELFGQGPDNSVLLVSPSFSFPSCTFGSGSNACNGTTPNLEAHDFGVNGLGNYLSGSPHTNVFWYMQGSSGGGSCTGSTMFNATFAGFGLLSSGSIGMSIGNNACGDPVYQNIVVENFGATPCNYNSGSSTSVMNAWGVMCWGASTNILTVNATSGTVNSVGGYYGGLSSNGPVVSITTNGAGIFNTTDDVFLAQFGLSSSTVFQANGLTNCGTVNLLGDSLTLASTTTGTSQVFFLNNTTCAVHIQNTQIAATGANNRCFLTSAGNNVFDDGGNTFSCGSTANSIAGLFLGSKSATGTALTTGKLALSANWGTSAAVSVPQGANSPIAFTITNGSAATGAGPTITYTFPVPYIVAPLWCTATQSGGTNPIGTFTAGTPTTTSVVFTYSLTPTATDTETVQVACFVTQ